ncbi:MAG TPA: hypothetical protein PLJ60_07320 [Chryseolinea sp.]|nr:hypothetical protein [Chryseolinea sp.]HPM30131.1 hypothetical protein [Chryseolinea sp.]
MKHVFVCIFLCFSIFSIAQDHGFPFGEVAHRELDIKSYDKDTSAVALVLNEFGEAYIDNSNDNNLLLEYHIKIKILKKAGTDQANFEIPLRKSNGKEEVLKDVQASSFNFENGVIKEAKLNTKSVFKEERSKYWNLQKFAIPNVRVGSVIEVKYTLESPYIYNFRTWAFQSEIPKVKSEYWATIPGNYIYNISLKGFLELSKNESELIRDCFTPGGGHKADCGRSMWAMKDIPAFVEEDYMTASSNFISTINFELSEIRFFDGRVDKISKEWKDVEMELRGDNKFGVQIKRGKDIVDGKVDQLIIGETDPLVKAKRIYDFIRYWYRWNDVYGLYSEFGIKKAFDTKTGNVGDINLSLIAALKYAELDVEALLLSTRANGLVTEIYPILSDFNYVVAKLNIGDKVYLLDATDDFVSFGLLPERCLNGKGRVFGGKESYWYEIKPADKEKTLSIVNLVLDSLGAMRGTIQYSYIGYKAASQRSKLSTFTSEKEYITDLQKRIPYTNIEHFEFQNADDSSKPLVLKLDVVIQAFDNLNTNQFLLNPFMGERLENNPFKSSERSYPVDFGAPLEEILVFSMIYPKNFEIDELPAKVGLALPNNGGRYICEFQQLDNRVTLNHSLQISRTIFSSAEYHYLKELFNRVIQVQQTDLVFKRK